jgi:parallel beta-helix repeat protein
MARKVLLLITCLCSAIFLGVVNPSLVHPRDCYIDGNTGMDDPAADGTGANPWKTINYALENVIWIETIYIKYATYHESVSLTPFRRRSINLIGIANGDARPVIRSGDPNTHTILLLNYMGKIEGLEISGAINANGINCYASGGASAGQIIDCKIYGNNQGIHLTTESSTEDCSPYIHKNFIYSNTTRGIGVMQYSSPTIDGNYIYQNGSSPESSLAGNGGIGNTGSSTATIINNVIYGNVHGGIFIRDNANPTIINNTITGAYDGAAIRVNQGLRDSESGSGSDDKNGGCFVATAVDESRNAGISSIEIVNNIITDNKDGLVSQGGQPCSGNDYNNLSNNSSYDYTGFTKGPNDIFDDPLFVDSENGDYHLQAGSPCIDAGTSYGAPDTDMDGNLRPNGEGYDMGAYES